MERANLHSTKVVLIATAFIFGAAGAGCEKTTTTTTTPTGTTTTTTVSPAPRVETAIGNASDVLSDAAITTKVKSALLADAEVKGLQIDVDTSNGVVSLSGAMDKAENIQRAESVAKGVDGVKSVNNRLTVKPS